MSEENMSEEKEKKNVGKILAKMLRKKNYWKWLALVENHNLKEACASQWFEVWKTLIRRAFQDPQGMRDFFGGVGSLRDRPDYPELRMLLLLGEFVESGAGAASGAAAPDRLACIPAAGKLAPMEPFREKVAAWREDFSPEKRIGAALEVFTREPLGVTEENYRALADALEGTGLDGDVRGLAGDFGELERRAGESEAAEGFAEDALGDMPRVDAGVQAAVRRLPAGLGRILLHPFACRTSKLFSRLCDGGRVGAAARLSSRMPFLFDAAAGGKAEEARIFIRRCAADPGASPGASMEEHEAQRALVQEMAAAATAATLEQRATLVARARCEMTGGAAPKGLAGKFVSLYRSVLSDIGKEMTALSERERKEVLRVLGPILLGDIHLVRADPPRLADLLEGAAASGCLDARLALLGLIVSGALDDRYLMQQVRTALGRCPPPSREDLGFVVEEFDDIVFPGVTALRPVIRFFGEDAPMLSVLPDLVMRKLDGLLTKLAMDETASEKKLLYPAAGIDEASEEDLFILQRELAGLGRLRLFSNVADLAGCFREGYFSMEAYERYLEKILARDGHLGFVVARLEGFHRFMSLRRFGPKGIFLGGMIFNVMFKDVVTACVRFLLDHMRKNAWGIETTSLEALGTLVEVLRGAQYAGHARDGLVVKLSKALEKRAAAGEEGAAALRDEVTSLLAAAAAGGRGRRGKSRKRIGGWPF